MATVSESIPFARACVAHECRKGIEAIFRGVLPGELEKVTDARRFPR
jgi:hypothetical protein